MPTQVAFGLAAFTEERGSDWGFYSSINTTLGGQYALAMERVNGGRGVARFDAPADIAFLIAALPSRCAKTGEPLHKSRALRLWDWLRRQQASDGTFAGQTLRNVQIHYLLRHAKQRLGDAMESSGSVLNRLNGAFSVGPNHVFTKGKERDYGEQVHAYRILSGDLRALSGHRINRLSQNGGWLYRGNTQSPSEGPTEAQALGWRLGALGIF